MLKKVLWIEDGAESELYNMLSPIFISGEYDLVVAKDATEAEERLRRDDFAAVIVDIRLPPGRDQKWIDVYKGYRQSQDAARLGLHLLRALFAPGEHAGGVAVQLPNQLSPAKFAVFSVEMEIESEVRALGVSEYVQKCANTRRTDVLDLIRRLTTEIAREQVSKKTT